MKASTALFSLPSPFDRTYEGLKPLLHLAPLHLPVTLLTVPMRV